jgi:hypothetical protein
LSKFKVGDKVKPFCEACNEGKSINGDRDVCKIIIKGNRLCLIYNDEFYSTSAKIKYCPICGKKLEVTHE